MRPPFDYRVQLTNVIALTMILVLWGGLYAVRQVSVTWRNVATAQRLARSHPGKVMP